VKQAAQLYTQQLSAATTCDADEQRDEQYLPTQLNDIKVLACNDGQDGKPITSLADSTLAKVESLLAEAAIVPKIAVRFWRRNPDQIELPESADDVMEEDEPPTEDDDDGKRSPRPRCSAAPAHPFSKDTQAAFNVLRAQWWALASKEFALPAKWGTPGVLQDPAARTL
jgi:hypothetical protein